MTTTTIQLPETLHDRQEQLNRAIQSMMVDKTLLQEGMNNLLSSQSIQGEPIGVEALQEQMRAANLAPNELSQSIIMAREVFDPEVDTKAELSKLLSYNNS